MRLLKSYSDKFPSSIDNICEYSNKIINFFECSLETISEDCEYELKVIINELLINAVKHGNQSSKDKFVSICAGFVDFSTIYMIIQDEGKGFDYKSIMDYNPFLGSIHSEDSIDFLDMKESGRGIGIVKCLSDKLKFNYLGNKVIVVKHIL